MTTVDQDMERVVAPARHRQLPEPHGEDYDRLQRLPRATGTEMHWLVEERPHGVAVRVEQHQLHAMLGSFGDVGVDRGNEVEGRKGDRLYSEPVVDGVELADDRELV